MNVFTTVGGVRTGAKCNKSMQDVCVGAEISIIDSNSLLPDMFVEVAKDPRITLETITDVARLFAVCLGGGVAVSGDLYLITPLNSLIEAVPFCASTKSGSPLPCVFGMERGDVLGATLMKCLTEMVSEGVDLVVRVQNTIGVVQSLFSHPDAIPTVNFLPYQFFAIFGIQLNAIDFVLADKDRQQQMLEQVSGRIKGATLFGVFAGQQRHGALPDTVRAVFKSARQWLISAPTTPDSTPDSTPTPKIQATVRQMASGIISAAKAAVGQAIKGESLVVDEGERERRLDICSGNNGNPRCEFYLESRGLCSLCGCIMKFKARLSSQSCPKGKW